MVLVITSAATSPPVLARVRGRRTACVVATPAMKENPTTEAKTECSRSSCRQRLPGTMSQHADAEHRQSEANETRSGDPGPGDPLGGRLAGTEPYP